MAGRENKTVYLYDTDGKYLREFESISLFARTFNFTENIFSGESRRWSPDVYEFEDGRIAALYKIGREGIVKYKRYKNSEFTKIYKGRLISETTARKSGKVGEIEVYNLDDELVATFKNIYFAKKFLNIPASDTLPFKNYTSEGLKFVLKNESV